MTTVNPYTSDPATERQIRFVTDLGGDSLHAHKLSKKECSSYITELLESRPAKPATQATTRQDVPGVTEPGVYETPDGVIYVVKPTRDDKTRLYAKRLIEINADRLTEADGLVQIEFEYVKGAVYKLTADMKMPLEKAKELTIRYGRCIVCGRRLKAAVSVERGIGPVCIRSFA